MRNAILAGLAILAVGCSVVSMTGCSTARTKFTDAHMRIILDPDSIKPRDFARIQQALVASGKWVVLDRAMAWEALKKEAERQHRGDASRFEDREKWLIWGRALGAGGIVVGHSQCQVKRTWFWGTPYVHCQQFLEIINSNTSEVVAAVERQQNGDLDEDGLAPSWEDTVADLNDAYPKVFKQNKDAQRLFDYRDMAEAEAMHQKQVVDKMNAANVGN